MELKSTSSFKDVDIDAMLEHTTFDEFMKGLYANKISKVGATMPASSERKNEFESMWATIMGGGIEEQAQEDLKLSFEKMTDVDAEKVGHTLMEAQALQNVRERRKRLAMSSIFDGSERKLNMQAEATKTPKDLENQIDLTQMQETKEQELLRDIDDELDILDAYIDPFDLKTQNKK